MVFDYAKVRAVVEDRRSMLGALTAAVAVHPTQSWKCDCAVSSGTRRLRPRHRPLCARRARCRAVGCDDVARFALSQLYILARLWVKLTFWASETALFQSRLAHAGYVARPVATWPDSPAADSIRYTSANL